jgi:hypothetical protein
MGKSGVPPFETCSDIFQFSKTIHGLVQREREFYKRLVFALKGCSF